MSSIFLPEYKPTTKTIDGRKYIYDIVRKRYFVLTPEEMVRQSFINYLVEHLGYPKSLISVEREVKMGRKSNRSDIHILTNSGDCFMLIECKSFKVKMNQDVFDQAAKYSSTLKAKYMVVTNGITTLCCSLDHEKKDVAFQDSLPEYPKS